MTISPLAGLLSRKRLLIFDFDGTLVDSSPLHARAFAEIFAPHGVAVDYPRIAGMTTDAAVDRLAADAGLQLDEKAKAGLVGAKRERGLALIERELAAIEGAPDFVRAAADHFRLALCTSGSRRSVDAALARVGLAGCFDPEITADDVRQGKPHPEAFLQVLERAKVAAEDALVFEDADSGIAAAAAAGIEALRVVPPGAARNPGEADWPSLNAALAELAPR
jgi:HAD superfamily hydrolase (TIGR01509 family)